MKKHPTWPQPLPCPVCGSTLTGFYLGPDGRPALEAVVTWLEVVAHGLQAHQNGSDPRATLPPRMRAQMERIAEAFYRALDASQKG